MKDILEEANKEARKIVDSYTKESEVRQGEIRKYTNEYIKGLEFFDEKIIQLIRNLILLMGGIIGFSSTLLGFDNFKSLIDLKFLTLSWKFFLFSIVYGIVIEIFKIFKYKMLNYEYLINSQLVYIGDFKRYNLQNLSNKNKKHIRFLRTIDSFFNILGLYLFFILFFAGLFVLIFSVKI